MKQYNLCFLGFGKVGRALARLLAVKAAELRETYDIEYRVTGVASRSLGRHANAAARFGRLPSGGDKAARAFEARRNG